MAVVVGVDTDCSVVSMLESVGFVVAAVTMDPVSFVSVREFIVVDISIVVVVVEVLV
jgi:hypothetical protein